MSAQAAPSSRGELRIADPFLRSERRRLGCAVGTGVLDTGCRLLAPWPAALAVDHALGGRPLDGPATVLNGLSPAGLLHDRMRTGEIVARLTTDVNRVADAVIATVTTLVPDLVLMTGALTLLFLVDPALAWLGLVVLPLLAWLTARRRRLVRAAQMQARETSGRLAAVATDLLHNVRAVQAFARRDRAARLFGQPNDRLVSAEVRDDCECPVDAAARPGPRERLRDRARGGRAAGARRPDHGRTPARGAVLPVRPELAGARPGRAGRDAQPRHRQRAPAPRGPGVHRGGARAGRSAPRADLPLRAPGGHCLPHGAGGGRPPSDAGGGRAALPAGTAPEGR